MRQTGVIPAPLKNLGNALLLAKVPPLNELHFQPGLTGQRHGVIAHRVPQRFSEPAQIKATNVGELKPPFQSSGMTHLQQIAGDDNAIKTTQLSGNL
jgi:hypothetical protein